MDFGTAIKTCFTKYFVFGGRALRSEFWWFTLFTAVVGIVLSMVDSSIFGAASAFTPLSTVFSLATLLPSLAVASRRLHDTNRSGWWQLLPLAPLPLLALALPVLMGGEGTPLAIAAIVLVLIAVLVLFILLIVWYASRGTDGPNRFGEDVLSDGLAVFD